MRSDQQIAGDACTIRGILELLQTEPEPITIKLVEFTQNVGWRTAKRLMENLAAAGIIERPVVEVDILGAKQKVPRIGWTLTAAAKQGRIPSAEDLARGKA